MPEIAFSIILLTGTSIAKTEDKNDALIQAATEGNLVEVNRLLSIGAKVNAKNERSTALMLASREGHLDVVKLLLEKGASVNTRNEIHGYWSISKDKA